MSDLQKYIKKRKEKDQEFAENFDEGYDKFKSDCLELVIDAHLYTGKYVATKSFTDRKVLCWEDNPSEVCKKAVELGIKKPVIVFIPKYRLCPSVWHIKRG